MASSPNKTPSFFPRPEFDHATAGIGAGVIAVLAMHPLDLLKVKLQVSTSHASTASSSIGRTIWNGLRDIRANEGWKGLYRGVGANIAGNASSWGLYFLFYNYLKRTASANSDPGTPLTAGQYLLYSAEASAVTAMMTNPIWVIKVRMFTTRADDPKAYRSLWDGLKRTYSTEGVRGLWRGSSLALFGVSNGAIQFLGYEEAKSFGFRRKAALAAASPSGTGRTWEQLFWGSESDKLSNTAYSVLSGASKLGALSLTYPYQVVRSRIQNNVTSHMYPTIRACVARTWAEEGTRGFYRGLGTNLVRVLPGTCITFVAYENIAWLLKRAAGKRDAKQEL